MPRRGVPLGPRPFRVISWRVRQRTLAPFLLPGRAGRAVCALPPHALCSLSSTILEEEKAQQEERMRMESRRQVAVSWDSGGPDEAPPKVAGAPAGVGGASTGHAKSSRCQTPLCPLLLCGALLSTCFPNLHFTCSDPRVIGFATTSNCPSWSAPPNPLHICFILKWVKVHLTVFLWVWFGFIEKLVPVALAGVLAWAFLSRALASPAPSLHSLDLHSSGQQTTPVFPCCPALLCRGLGRSWPFDTPLRSGVPSPQALDRHWSLAC